MSRPLSSKLCVTFFAICACTLFALSSAQADKPPERDEAKEYLETGGDAYKRGRYRVAIDLFQKGYRILPDPWFHFNIAQSYRMLKDCDNALYYYRRFLARVQASVYRGKRNPTIEKEAARWIAKMQQCAGRRPARTRDDHREPLGHPDDDVSPSKRRDEMAPARVTAPPVDSGSTTRRKPTDGDFDDDGDDGFDDDDDGVPAAGVSADVDQTPGYIHTSAELGFAFVSMGDQLDIPTSFAFALSGGYPISVGPAKLVVGLGVTYTRLPWQNNSEPSGSSLIGVLAHTTLRYPIYKRFSLRSDVGFGAAWLTNLVTNNPFTVGGVASSGALATTNLRVAIGGEYQVTSLLRLSLIPFSYETSPSPDGLRASIGSMRRITMYAGASLTY